MSEHDANWQPNQPPVPGAYRPEPPKKNWFLRHKIWTILLGLLLIAGVSAAINGGGSSSTAPASDSPDGGAADTGKETAPSGEARPTEAAKPKGARKGHAVRDGKFEFVVTTVKNGPARIGDQYVNETAQGRFLLITVKVTNIGDEARQLSDSNQKLFDTSGRSYEASSTAGVLLPDNKVLYENINPGNSVTATLVFDVPRTAKPGRIELHDGLLSGGVTVNLD